MPAFIKILIIAFGMLMNNVLAYNNSLNESDLLSCNDKSHQIDLFVNKNPLLAKSHEFRSDFFASNSHRYEDTKREVSEMAENYMREKMEIEEAGFSGKHWRLKKLEEMYQEYKALTSTHQHFYEIRDYYEDKWDDALDFVPRKLVSQYNQMIRNYNKACGSTVTQGLYPASDICIGKHGFLCKKVRLSNSEHFPSF